MASLLSYAMIQESS